MAVSDTLDIKSSFDYFRYKSILFSKNYFTTHFIALSRPRAGLIITWEKIEKKLRKCLFSKNILKNFCGFFALENSIKFRKL